MLAKLKAERLGTDGHDMAVLRWGILGTARINRRVIPAMRLGRRSELAAVASRDRARAEAYARTWSIPRAIGGLPGACSTIRHRRRLHSAAQHRSRAVDAGGDRRRQARAVRKAARARPARRRSHRRGGAAAAVSSSRRLHVSPRAAHGEVVELVARRRRRHRPRRRVGLHLRARPATANIRLDPALGGGALWDVGSYPSPTRS